MIARLRVRVLLLCLLGGLGQIAYADSLGAEIDGYLYQALARRAFWGIKVVELESGATLYERNPDKLFLPASNAKLFSTALALERLGPEYQFLTKVLATAAPSPDGTIAGDLVLVGGGDPNLSARVIPYNSRKNFDRDPMLPLTELARQVVEVGIRRVEGNIIGDDSRYVRQYFADGWSRQDVNWGYGAPVGALCFNDNVIEIFVRPGAAGRPARVSARPAIGYYSFENRIRTASTRTVAQALALDREPGARSVALWGEISIRSPGRTFSVAVDDPAMFAAFAFRHELERLGVEVTGEALARHSWPWDHRSLKRASLPVATPEGQVVAAIQSPRLADAIRVINKESQNLHAEMLLREVGYRLRNVGSYEAGLEELEAFLKQAGLSSQDFDFSDASGLSRKDLISPMGTVQLLTHMWNSPLRDAYLASLPLAGEDGTLDWRFSRTSARGQVQAKTGTLDHVTALSGYATMQDGRTAAFSILVNNFSVAGSYIRSLVDKIAVAITQSRLESAPSSSAPSVPASVRE